jgi:hypothetical protein
MSRCIGGKLWGTLKISDYTRHAIPFSNEPTFRHSAISDVRLLLRASFQQSRANIRIGNGSCKMNHLFPFRDFHYPSI